MFLVYYIPGMKHPCNFYEICILVYSSIYKSNENWVKIRTFNSASQECKIIVLLFLSSVLFLIRMFYSNSTQVFSGLHNAEIYTIILLII